jgi:glutathione S-transferase
MSAAHRYRVYLMDVSYFSGKLEAYLRYKEVPFERIEVTWRELGRRILHETGVMKVPVVETPDGAWLQDTTPIIDWFEERFSEAPVIPEDPYQAFLCRLLEDYADEWLWRPALHYRWSHARDARLLGDRLAAEVMRDVLLPHGLLAARVRRRQFKTYVRGDGVNARTRTHVEGIYLATLDRLQRLLARQPYLLGERPCLADFGFFASMFRHFSLDPTPARIMRERAPAVYAWVARLWNARRSDVRGAWWAPGTIPEIWREILTDVGEAYLPYLHANAVAWKSGVRRMDASAQGVTYRRVPVVHYRVWCRERLQDHFEALPSAVQAKVRETLECCSAWEPLWRDGRIASRLHEGTTPPVCRRGHASPRRRLQVELDPWNPPVNTRCRERAKARGEGET